MIRILAVTLISFLACVFNVANAQQKPEIVEFNFTTLSWQKLIDDLYYRNADGEAVKLWVPNGSPSDAYTYKGVAPLRFFRITGYDAEQNPIEETAAVFNNINLREQLLVFMPHERNTYRIVNVDFAKTEVVENNYRFVNLSEYPLYIRFGEKRLNLPARDDGDLIIPTPESGGLNIAMAIRVENEGDGKLKMAYSSSWAVRSGRSALVFVTNTPKAKDRVQVKKLYF